MSEHKSPAYRLLALVAEESQHTTWRNINPARSDALTLAITGALRFAPSDFADFHRSFGAGFWMGPDPEVWYTLACRKKHKTAIISIERWLGRERMVWEGEPIYVGRVLALVPGDLGDHGHLSKGWRVTSILPDGFRLKRAPREEIRNYDGTVASEASPGRMVFVSRADLVAATTESKARAKAAKRRGQGEESNEAIEGDVRRMT